MSNRYGVVVALVVGALFQHALAQPVGFIENRGQWSSEVQFYASAPSIDYWITPEGITLTYYHLLRQHPAEPWLEKGHILRLTLDGTQLRSVQPMLPLAGHLHYIRGKHRSTNVSRFAELLYPSIYPEIDLRFYQENRYLRYDFIVHPGGDPQRIRWKITGADSAAVVDDKLLLYTSIGHLITGELFVYQKINDSIVPRNAHFQLQRHTAENPTATPQYELGFVIDSYDSRYPLIIDPLLYSTFIGGSSTDVIYGIAKDNNGNIYIAGVTRSADYPTTTGAYDTTYSNTDAFVTKLLANGTTLAYSTFIGGSSTDVAYDLAIDNSGNAYITGYTRSSDFPTTTGAYDTTYASRQDIFVTKVNATGSDLVFSTFLGVNGDDVAFGIALNGNKPVITGFTTSTNFPTSSNPVDNTHQGTSIEDLVLVQLNATGSSIEYSTFFSASPALVQCIGTDVTVHNGKLYITGIARGMIHTTSTAFDRTPNFHSWPNMHLNADAFLAIINPQNNGINDLVYSTYFGGKNKDWGNSIAVDNNGYVYIFGSAYADYDQNGNPLNSFPTTTGAFDTTSNSTDYTSIDAFIAKFNPADSGTASLLYATFYGGTNDDYGGEIAVAGDTVFVAGNTKSSDIPLTDGAYFSTAPGGASDLFFAAFQLNGNGQNDLLYATYFGGNAADGTISPGLARHIKAPIALEKSVPNSTITVGSYTSSPNFPITPTHYDSTLNGTRDGCIVSFQLLPSSLILLSPTTATVLCPGDSVEIRWQSVGFTHFVIERSNPNTTTFGTPLDTVQINTRAQTTVSWWWVIPPSLPAGVYRIRVRDLVNPTAADTSAPITIYAPPSIQIQPTDQTVCLADSAMFTATATGTPSPSAQWQLSTDGGMTWSNLSSTGDTLYLTAVEALDSAMVRVTYTNSCGSTTSTTAQLFIQYPPTITATFPNLTLCAGDTLRINPSVTGTPAFSFRWEYSEDLVSWTLLSSDSTLLITNISSALDSTFIRFVATNSCGSDTSNAFSLTVNEAPMITLSPSLLSTCPSDTLTLNATLLQGQPEPIFIWQSSYNGITWSIIDTTFQSQLQVIIGNLSASFYVRVIALNSCGSDTSNAIEIAVLQIPKILDHPASLTACVGDTVSFTVTAIGDTLSYQWYHNNAPIAGATDSILTIANITTADAGDYFVIVSGVCSPPDTSQIAQLTVYEPPLITRQPDSLTVCLGEQAIFSVAATGDSLSYQWYKNGSPINGATDSVLILPAVSASDEALYTVVVSGICSPSVSADAQLIVNEPPQITAHPDDLTACVGDTVSFTVTATGDTLSYQWYHNNAPIAGATDSILTIANITTADAGDYFVIVSGVCSPPDTSQIAQLTVYEPPQITQQPDSLTVCLGEQAIFSVAATGDSLSYQWYKNGAPINGATDSVLVLPAVSAADEASYQVIVSGVCSPPDTSVAVFLTVNEPPQITRQPDSLTVCLGEQAIFSVAATGDSLSYQWYKNGAPINGATDSVLILPAVSASDEASYQVIVSGVCSPPDTSVAVFLTVNEPPQITTDPASLTACIGDTVSFTVTATGDTLSYQWYHNNAPIAGATDSILTIANITTADAGDYFVIVSGVCSPPDTSQIAQLTVYEPPLITRQPDSLTVCLGEQAIFSVAATGDSLSYQWYKNGSPINGATDSVLILPAVSASDEASYQVIVSGVCSPPDTSVAVFLTVNEPPQITQQPDSLTVCLGEQAIFSVAATGDSLSYQWYKNGSPINGATDSVLILPAVSASDEASYQVIVSGVCSPPDTSVAVFLTVNEPPQITRQPDSLTVCLGEQAIFSVAATGDSLSYQWYKNGAPINGATDSVLILPAVSASDEASYQVIVSGVCSPPDTSVAVFLTVNEPPQITQQPDSLTVCLGDRYSLGLSRGRSAFLPVVQRQCAAIRGDRQRLGALRRATERCRQLLCPNLRYLLPERFLGYG